MAGALGRRHSRSRRRRRRRSRSLSKANNGTVVFVFAGLQVHLTKKNNPLNNNSLADKDQARKLTINNCGDGVASMFDALAVVSIVCCASSAYS